MKKALIAAGLIFAFVSVADAQTNVRGYYRDSNGDGWKDTYVQPYQRTAPNNLRTDNYSYPGNYNPNQGHFTPYSNSQQQNYPVNPNPYQQQRRFGW